MQRFSKSSFFTYITNRIYYALWLTLPKQHQTIEGFSITYVILPFLINLGSKKTFRAGMVLRLPFVDEPMIFISRRKSRTKYLRYALFHEYWEMIDHFHLPSRITENDLNARVYGALRAWNQEVPDLQQRVERHNSRGGSPKHVRALAVELDLARRELSTHEYTAYLREALDQRL